MSLMSYCRKIGVSLIGVFSIAAWAGNENIVAFYITNSGIILSVGQSDHNKSDLHYAMDTTSEPTMVGDPPTLAFTDSPLKFFRTFMDEYGYKLQQVITDKQHKDLPVKVYIGAAGADRAASQSTPSADKIGYYLDLYPGQSDACLKVANKKEFFACMFELDLTRWLPRNLEVVIEQDTHLMATMASQYHENTNKDRKVEAGGEGNVLMVHTTTYSEPYRVSTCDVLGRCKKVKLPQDSERLGGPFQAGSMFRDAYLMNVVDSDELQEVTKKFRADLNQKKTGQLTGEILISQAQFEQGLRKVKNSDLVCAVYSDPVLHKVCHRENPKSDVGFRGAPYMMYRLSESWLGCNLFGDKVRDVAWGMLPPSIGHGVSTCMDFDIPTAKNDAQNLINYANKSLLDIVITFYYSEYADELQQKSKALPPSLVLVGENVDFFESYALNASTSFNDVLLTMLTNEGYPKELRDLLKRHEIPVSELPEFQKWINDYAVPLVQEMTWVPSKHFSDYLHAAAKYRLNRAGK